MDWLAKILGHTNNQRPVSLHICVREGGFDVVIQAELPIAVKVDWPDIKKIEAFRFDEDGEESISLRFSLFWGRRQITLYRSDVGFNDVTPALTAAFPGVSGDWEARIEAPFGCPPHEVLYESG